MKIKIRITIKRMRGSDAGAEVVDGFLEALFKRNDGLPDEPFARASNVGLALAGIVLRQRAEGDLAFGVGEANDKLSEVEHRHFRRVTYIHRLPMVAHHKAVDAFYELGVIAERTGL